MHFDREVDFVPLQVLMLLLPIGDNDFLPLPVEDVSILIRPGASDPVGVDRAGVVARTSAEAVDDRYTQSRGDLDGVNKRVVVGFSGGPYRVNRVAVN